MRLEPCERRGQGTTVKIRIQDGAIYIAPEDDEERQVTEITINTLCRWVAQHDKEKETAMNNTDADTAISALDKLIDQELAAVRAASRDGNRPLYEISSTRYHAYLTAKDEITKALADAMEERDAENPFLPQRDELVTMDIHTCDLCGRWCSSPVYSVGLIYGGQAKTVTEVCADCMRRLKFQPVRTIPLDMYRLFERWLDEQKETER